MEQVIKIGDLSITPLNCEKQRRSFDACVSQREVPYVRWTLPSQELIFGSMISIIRGAMLGESLSASSFWLEYGPDCPHASMIVDELKNAMIRGVDVKVLTQLRRDFIKLPDRETLRRHHILAIKELAKVGIPLRFREDIHAKSLVSDRAALVTSANFTENSLVRNPELAVMFSNFPDLSAVRQILELTWEIWSFEAQYTATLGFGIIERSYILDDFCLRELRSFKALNLRATYSPTSLKGLRSLSDEVSSLIDSANDEILISTYIMRNLSETKVGRSLVKALKRGVAVRIVTRLRSRISRKDDSIERALKLGHYDQVHFRSVSELLGCGASIRGNEMSHAKAVVADGHSILFSANIDPKGLEHGVELGYTLEKENAEIVSKFIAYLWENAETEASKTFRGCNLPSNVS